MSSQIKRTRGRPRSEEAKRAILQAARDLLARGGPAAVTMEAVAEAAGVGKPTVYRWWPDRHAVAMAALMETGTADSEDSKRRSPIAELRDQLHAIVRRFETPTGRHVATMIAAADSTSELSKAFRNHFVLARRTEGKQLLERAIAEGLLRDDLAIEVVLDMLYGPVFFRLLLGHATLDEAFTDAVVDEALAGMTTRKRRRR
jgi:AcrR family transcriptional regulator